MHRQVGRTSNRGVLDMFVAGLEKPSKCLAEQTDIESNGVRVPETPRMGVAKPPSTAVMRGCCS